MSDRALLNWLLYPVRRMVWRGGQPAVPEVRAALMPERLDRLNFARWVVAPWPRAHLTTFGGGYGIVTLCGLETEAAGTYDYLPDEKDACKTCTRIAKKRLEAA